MIPKQFLKSIKRSGFGRIYLMSSDILMRGARRIIHGESRFSVEYAVLPGRLDLARPGEFWRGSTVSMPPGRWKISAFVTVIAPSFADIFRSNALKNGILPMVLPVDQVDTLFSVLRAERAIP